jgi:hypothetical protein
LLSGSAAIPPVTATMSTANDKKPGSTFAAIGLFGAATRTLGAVPLSVAAAGC